MYKVGVDGLSHVVHLYVHIDQLRQVEVHLFIPEPKHPVAWKRQQCKSHASKSQRNVLQQTLKRGSERLFTENAFPFLRHHKT